MDGHAKTPEARARATYDPVRPTVGVVSHFGHPLAVTVSEPDAVQGSVDA